MQKVVVLVLGGGRGTRLFPLTQFRSKPAVPLAGKYRLIDIPLSNCINSGMNRIYVLTQFMSVSLHRHIRQTYRFDSFGGGFVEILAAQQTMEQGTDWYEGTADAVRKNLRYIEESRCEHVLILSGDQLYRMDFDQMLDTHVSLNADATIAGIPVSRSAARSLGIMRLNDQGRVIGFVEKPQTDEAIQSVTMDPAWIDARGIPSQGRDCLASMGIYLFRKDVLIDVLRSTSYEDFGRQVFPSLIEPKRVQVHLFDGYWEDIGTIRAFYDANLQLADSNPQFDLGLPEGPIYTQARFLPPARIDNAQISRSYIADGCRIGKGVVIQNSVVGQRCVIGNDVTIRNSVIMGADFYETDLDLQKNHSENRPPIGISDKAVIENAILDKNCRIGAGARIFNRAGIQESPHAHELVRDKGYLVSDGIVVVVKDGTVPAGTEI
ncbi:MAG: glucose-1-phosphate adenylyltransferase [Pirellulales bacterium]